MLISPSEAIDTLAEWRQKRKIIQGGMVDSLGNNVGFFGCIEELDDHSVRIDARGIAKKAKNAGIVLGLPEDALFSFGEWPATPPEYSGHHRFHFEAYLTVTFSNGTRCELYATNL